MKKILITTIIAIGAQNFVGAQNLVPLQAQTIIFVKPDGTGNGSSWADACNLEHAVGNKSAVGMGFTPTPPQIWVQTGTYYPSAMLTIPDSVKMYGGFSGTETDLSQRDFVGNPTIIDAQKKFGSVVRLSPFAELNGFTIQNGNANDNPHKNGGGVWMDDNSTIANCKIINNSAAINGGGLYAKGSVNVKNCTIENNMALVEGANVYGGCISGLLVPIINKHPNAVAQSRMVDTAFSALSVSVAGASPFSYQWYFNTTNNNTDGTPIQGATKAFYTPSSTTVGTFYYYCEITDSSGTVISNVSGAHTVGGCAAGTFNLGTVSFASATTRTIIGKGITQVWSDAVTATGCQKTAFNGGTSGAYKLDCRSNPSYPGDLFSWCLVMKYVSTLCPAPWRVPTRQDFIDLDKAFGGTGENRNASSYVSFINTNYIGKWGAAYGGFAYAGALHNQGFNSRYWPQTEHTVDNGYYLYLTPSGDIYPQNNGHIYYKASGFALRCVR